jgi:ribulose-5-phosphate 4-epimerase/fuculose-1-phosphate aldolase
MLDQLCEVGNDFYARGDAFGGTGNLSVRMGEAVWITPTGTPLKGLTPSILACIGLDGRVLLDALNSLLHLPSNVYSMSSALVGALASTSKARWQWTRIRE